MRHSMLALATGLLAGCATAAPVAQPDPIVEWAPPPLTAHLYEAGRGAFVFEVSDDAFVAIFEIVPNAGASIMYPARPGQYNYVRGGGTRVVPSIIRPAGRWLYVSGFRSSWEPTYYYLVASRRPLALGPLLTRIGGVREALGWRQFVTGNPYATMDRLAEAVLPPGAVGEDDWTDDLLVVFPPPPVRYAGYRSPDGPTNRHVRCANGRRHFVYDLPAGCFDRSEPPTRPDSAKPPTTPTPPTPPGSGGDSAATSTPTPGGTPEPPEKYRGEQPVRRIPAPGRTPRKLTVVADREVERSVTGRLGRATFAAPDAGRRSGRVVLDGRSWSSGGPPVAPRRFSHEAEHQGAGRRGNTSFDPAAHPAPRSARGVTSIERADSDARQGGSGGARGGGRSGGGKPPQ